MEHEKEWSSSLGIKYQSHPVSEYQSLQQLSGEASRFQESHGQKGYFYRNFPALGLTSTKWPVRMIVIS